MRNLVLRFRWSVPPSFIFQKLIGNSLFSWRLFFSFFFWWFQYTRWLWFCQYLFLNLLFNFSNPFSLFMLSHFIIFYIQFTTISLVSKQSMKIIVLKGKIHKILPPKMLDSTRSGAFSHSNINRLCLKGIPSRFIVMKFASSSAAAVNSRTHRCCAGSSLGISLQNRVHPLQGFFKCSCAFQ